MSIIFSDFDGTLTDGSDLGPIFFDILGLIKANHSSLVIVSGRSLSWGHFYLTHFPIDVAIMEGGGVLTYRDKYGRIIDELLVADEEVERLHEVTEALKKNFSTLGLSADSFGRRTDRAIELDDLVGRQLQVEAFLKNIGVNFSCSSVHLNYWCGEISKARAVNHFIGSYHPNMNKQECLYFGDALNDQSMFKEFKNSVGVSNIQPYLQEMEHKPSVILLGEENRGPYGVYNYLKDFWK